MLMAKRKPFWTPRLLIELRVKSRTMTDRELEKYFGKPINEIKQAIVYEQNKRTLLIETTTEKINGRNVKIYRYKAGIADGAIKRSSPFTGHRL